ncbi:MAG: glycosyltransferase family 39 protein [Sedimentisphaerales bacterium]
MSEKQTQRIWLTAITLSIIIASVYLFMITRTTLWDRDEPRFARASIEMIQTRNYLVPSFNGQLWADKPILVYWLMSLSISLFGNNEFACRFWAAIGTVISCLITFAIGKKVMGARQGLWAMIILASSVMILVIGTAATADAITLPFILGAMAVFISGLTNGFRYYQVILIGVLTGFGMLAKGPIGALPFPVMIITVWLLGKDYKEFIKNSFLILVSLSIGIIIFLCWAIPADRATDGRFLAVFIGRHVISRAFEPMGHHGGDFLLYLPYYLPVIIGGFFPWIIFLPGAIYAVAVRKLCQRECRITLLTWVISIFIIMTFAATKLPHYIIFIWPPLALLAAGGIVEFQENLLSKRDEKWLHRGNWLFVPFGLTVGSALIIAPFFLKITNLFVPAIICGIILLFMTLLAAYRVHRNQVVSASKTLLFGIVLFHIPYIFGILPVIEDIKVTPSMAKTINEMVPIDVPVAVYEYKEPSLNYYLGRNLQELWDQEGVVAWVRQKNPAVLVIPDDEYEKIERVYGTLPGRLLYSREGIDYSEGKRVKLLALLFGQE